MKNKITNYFNRIPKPKLYIIKLERECCDCKDNEKMFCFSIHYKCCDESCINFIKLI